MKAIAAEGGGRVELVPLFSVWASPGGRLGQEAYDTLTGMLQQTLREVGEIDGLYLAMHGAMRGPASKHDNGLFLFRACTRYPSDRRGGAPCSLAMFLIGLGVRVGSASRHPRKSPNAPS